MSDLHLIGGDRLLHEGLQAGALHAASRNSIFVAHMVSNSLKHAPPPGLLRGLATLHTGEHRHHIDLKLNGVVLVVDLDRVYAPRGELEAVNTHARLHGSRRPAPPASSATAAAAA